MAGLPTGLAAGLANALASYSQGRFRGQRAGTEQDLRLQAAQRQAERDLIARHLLEFRAAEAPLKRDLLRAQVDVARRNANLTDPHAGDAAAVEYWRKRYPELATAPESVILQQGPALATMGRQVQVKQTPGVLRPPSNRPPSRTGALKQQIDDAQQERDRAQRVLQTLQQGIGWEVYQINPESPTGKRFAQTYEPALRAVQAAQAQVDSLRGVFAQEARPTAAQPPAPGGGSPAPNPRGPAAPPTHDNTVETQAEYDALRATGLSDDEIRSRYHVAAGIQRR